MEGLIVMLALIVGAVLATGVSMAGLRLITSFVPGPALDADGDADTRPEERGAAARPTAS